MMDCAHARRIYLQERDGNSVQVCLTRLLAELPDGSLLAPFLPKIDRDAPKRPLRCRAAIASNLIAGLELARDGSVALEQDGYWMPIRVGRRDRAP